MISSHGKALSNHYRRTSSLVLISFLLIPLLGCNSNSSHNPNQASEDDQKSIMGQADQKLNTTSTPSPRSDDRAHHLDKKSDAGQAGQAGSKEYQEHSNSNQQDPHFTKNGREIMIRPNDPLSNQLLAPSK